MNKELLELLTLQNKMLKETAKQISILYVINGILVITIAVHVIFG